MWRRQALTAASPWPGTEESLRRTHSPPPQATTHCTTIGDRGLFMPHHAWVLEAALSAAAMLAA